MASHRRSTASRPLVVAGAVDATTHKTARPVVLVVAVPGLLAQAAVLVTRQTQRPTKALLVALGFNPETSLTFTAAVVVAHPLRGRLPQPELPALAAMERRAPFLARQLPTQAVVVAAAARKAGPFQAELVGLVVAGLEAISTTPLRLLLVRLTQAAAAVVVGRTTEPAQRAARAS